MKKTKKNDFQIGELVVYPKHGVGEIQSVSTIEVSNIKTKCYIIRMEQSKLLIRIPVDKKNEIGLRKIASKKRISEVFNILGQKPKIRRIMWSRRAQEYDAKIHSGDPIKIGEVIRDLFRKNNQPDQSYSERQMFQIALERLAREVAAIENTDYFNATEKIENIYCIKGSNNMQINSKFAEFEFCNNIWAIGSIHSNLHSFEKIKNHILKNFSKNDKIIFLGNIIGVGEFAKETLSSVIDMRLKIMSKFLLNSKDIIFLRGAQEEMFLKVITITNSTESK